MNSFLTITPDGGKLEVEFNKNTVEGYRANITSGTGIPNYLSYQKVFVTEVVDKLDSGGAIPASNCGGIIDNAIDAINHYFQGGGAPVELGPRTLTSIDIIELYQDRLHHCLVTLA